MPDSNSTQRSLPSTLGAVRGDLGVAEQLLGAAARARGDADARRRSRARSVARQREGRAQRFEQAFGDQLRRRRRARPPRRSTTNSSPPRRPSASVSRTSPSRRAATPRSSSSPASCPSVSLMTVKLSRLTCSAATGVPLRARAAQHLLGRGRGSACGWAGPSAGRGVARKASCSPRLSSSASWRMRSLSKTSHIRTSVTSSVAWAIASARCAARGR